MSVVDDSLWEYRGTVCVQQGEYSHNRTNEQVQHVNVM